MIEYLEQLVKEKQYEKALAYAEQMLLNADMTSHEMLAVYQQVLKARLESGEFYGAQVAGELAIQMAQELNEWDRYGHVALMLGTVFIRLRQEERALACYYDYLAHLPQYGAAAEFEALVLYNIATVYNDRNQREEALSMLLRAEEAASRAQNLRFTHGIRHAMIGAYLSYDMFREIPPLLAKCAAFLRRNPEVPQWHDSLLWHHILRVRYAVETNRLGRALKVAKRGLLLSDRGPATKPSYKHRFHMLIARIYERIQEPRLALEHGMQARLAATEARRYDLEYDAGLYIYSLVAAHPESLSSASHDLPEEWDLSFTKPEEEEG